MSTAQTNTATLEVSVWFERDRKHLALSRPDGSLAFELRDEEIDEAIEDGFLTSPRHPRRRRLRQVAVTSCCEAPGSRDSGC